MSSSSLEARVAHVGGIIEQLRARLASVEDRLARLEDRLTALGASLDARMSALDARLQSNFQWILGVMLSMWISIILAVLLKGRRQEVSP